MKHLIDKFNNQFLQAQGQLSILFKLCCILISKEHSLALNGECLCNSTFMNKLESISLIACKIFINNYIKSMINILMRKDHSLTKGRLKSFAKIKNFPVL